MVVLGALIDALFSCLGGVAGCVLKQRIKADLGDFLMAAVSLAIIVLGIQGMAQANNILATTLEMVLGAYVGYRIDLDLQIKKIGDRLQRRLESKYSDNPAFSNIATGFVNSTLVVCVGSMGIVGALDAGLLGNNTTLYAKAVMDFVINALLATTMGAGVIFSGFVVIVYEGILSLGAQSLSTVLVDATVHEMMVVGSVLLFALGLDMLNIKKLKVANLIPACFMPIIILPIFALLGL